MPSATQQDSRAANSTMTLEKQEGSSKHHLIDVDNCLRQIRAWLREPENQLLAALGIGLLLAWEFVVALAIYNLFAGGPLN